MNNLEYRDGIYRMLAQHAAYKISVPTGRKMEITRFFLKLTKQEGRILVDLAYDTMIMYNIPMHGKPSAADTRRVQDILARDYPILRRCKDNWATKRFMRQAMKDFNEQ